MAIERAAIRTADGSYVCAENAGDGPLVANRPAIGPWEIFDFAWVSDDAVAFRAVNGKYVTLLNDFPFWGGLFPAATEVGERETFGVLWHGDDRVTFQGFTGSFVCAEGGGGGEVVVNRPAIGEWEKFQLEMPPAT
jgi:hypothetical protein